MNIRKGILAGVVAAADYSKSEFTWGLFTGWRFNKYFAAELGYYKPASITSSVSGASSKLSLHTIAARGVIPVPSSTLEAGQPWQ